MSYHQVGDTDPFKLFDQKLAELRQGKADEDAGKRPPGPKSTIKWWCWDTPGFKDCHGGPAFRAAQADCEASGHRDDPNCITPLADRYSEACPCAKEPPDEGLFANKYVVAGLIAAGLYVLFARKKAS